jgi:serine phosphatase RsbU (regulator of sigma subunit)
MGFEWEPTSIELDDGDCVVLITDGATEAGRARRAVGLGGVSRAIGGCTPTNAQALADVVVSTAIRSTPGGVLSDDIAVLALCRGGRAAPVDARETPATAQSGAPRRRDGARRT